jgi:hypothetical protein
MGTAAPARALKMLVPAGVAAVSVLALVAIPATPAGAVQRDQIVVDVNQTVTVKFPAFAPATNYQQGRKPANCSVSTRLTCDAIPVTLNVDAGELAEHSSDYLLTVETDWNARVKQTVQGQGVVSDNQLNTYVYTDPPRMAGDPPTVTEEWYSSLDPPPTSLSFPAPIANKWTITVENFAGYNDGYTLKITLLYVGGGPGADASIDSNDGAAPTDFSDFGNVAITSSFDGAAGAGSLSGGSVDFASLGAAISGEPGTKAIALSLAQLQADNDLDSLSGIDDAAVLRLQPARSFANISIGAPPRVRKASPMAIVAWLIVVPALVAVASAAWIYRRRTVVAGVTA